MTGDMVCLRCDGEGRQVWDEDGVRCLDTCYACLGAGWVDADAAHDQRLGGVCDQLGVRRAAAFRRACDEDPCGDGFVLRAAENMLSCREYEEILAMEYADEAMRLVASWTREQQAWLIALAEWPSMATGDR